MAGVRRRRGELVSHFHTEAIEFIDIQPCCGGGHYEKIRTRLGEKVWCDWEVISCRGDVIVIGGGETLSVDHEVIIEFRGVDAFCGKLEWTTEDQPMFEIIADDEEQLKINTTLGVTAARILFAMTNTKADRRRQVIAATSMHLIKG